MTKRSNTCPECGQAGLIELQMKAKGGQELTMLSCSRCESRRWLSDGSPVERAEVLRLTSGNPDFVPAPVERPRRGVRTG